MKNRIFQFVLPVVLLVCFAVPTAIAAENPVKVHLSAKKEVITKDKTGKSIMSYDKADKAGKGDVVVYTLICENTGKDVIKQVELTDPIAAGTAAYIDGSATDADKKVSQITFSIDKGKTYAVQSKLTYKSKDSKGNVVEKLATPDMYTNVKWLVDSLSPGEKVSVSFKVKLL